MGAKRKSCINTVIGYASRGIRGVGLGVRAAGAVEKILPSQSNHSDDGGAFGRDALMRLS